MPEYIKIIKNPRTEAKCVICNKVLPPNQPRKSIYHGNDSHICCNECGDDAEELMMEGNENFITILRERLVEGDQIEINGKQFINKTGLSYLQFVNTVEGNESESLIQRTTENGNDLYIISTEDDTYEVVDYSEYLEQLGSGLLESSYKLTDEKIVTAEESDYYMWGILSRTKYDYLVYFFEHGMSATDDPEMHCELSYCFAKTKFWAENILEQFKVYFSFHTPDNYTMSSGDVMRLAIEVMPQIEYVAVNIENLMDNVGGSARVLKKINNGNSFEVYEFEDCYDENNKFSQMLNDAFVDEIGEYD